MPSPFLRSTGGPPLEFYCSLCKTKFEATFPDPRLGSGNFENALAEHKAGLLKEWDEHLAGVHPRQWERQQRKRARHLAAAERRKQQGGA